MAESIDWSQDGELREYQPGDMVFQEGDPGDSLHAIRSGRVVILKRDKEGFGPLALGYRDAGRLVGEVSLLLGAPRTASVQAVEPTQIYVIPREAFWRRFDADAEFRRLIMDTLISHLLAADAGRIIAAATQRELAEAIRLRQETTNFIIHDLQNPLNIILNALLEIQASPGYEPVSELGEMVDMANRASERMLRLVSTLLDTEKLTQADKTLDLTQFSMAQLINEIVERVRPIASHKDVRLVVAPMDADLPLVEADRLRIDRTLTNLIDNALKFTPASGCVTVGARRDDAAVLVWVNDTGPGIPPENREQVFLRFVQSGAGKASQRGFGLGLAYSHAAIAAHDGRIWVDDGDNSLGSKFVFALPIGPRQRS